MIHYIWSWIFQSIEWIYVYLLIFCSRLVLSSSLWVSGREVRVLTRLDIFLFFHCIPSCALSVFHPAFFYPLCRPTQLTHGQMTKTCVCVFVRSCANMNLLTLQLRLGLSSPSADEDGNTNTNIFLLLSGTLWENSFKCCANIRFVPGDGLITIRRLEVKGQGDLVNPFFHTTLEFTS